MKIEAVFLDRDGTIGGDGWFIHPSDFKPFENFYEARNMLKEKGIKIFSFTNQNRIARGEVTIEDFKQEFFRYGFTDVYICPHELKSECDCQKPKPGMLLKAKKDYDLDLTKCAVIGDVGIDMVAADAVGAIKIIVKTGWGLSSLEEYRNRWEDIEPDYIAKDVLDGVKWLIDKNYTEKP